MGRSVAGICLRAVIVSWCVSILPFVRISEFSAELQRGGVLAEVIIEPHRAPFLEVQLRRLAGAGVDIVQRVIGEAVDVIRWSCGIRHHAIGGPLWAVGIAIESADEVAAFPNGLQSFTGVEGASGIAAGVKLAAARDSGAPGEPLIV